MTFGGKGAHYTINSKGTRTKSVGIPGTGLSYVDVKNPERRSSTPQGEGQGPTRTGNGQRNGFGCLSFVLIILVITAIVTLFSGHSNVVFGSLLFISAILAIVSLFKPKLAFWTKKKTKARAFVGYAILSIILFIAFGATSPASQPSSSSTDNQTAAVTDSSSSSDSGSSQDDSSIWSNASDSTDSSVSDGTASSSDSSSSSVTSQPATAVTPSAGESSGSHAVVSKPASQAQKSTTSAPKKASAPASSTAPKSAPAPTLAVTGGGLNVSPGQIASVSTKGSPNAPASIQVIYSSGPSKAAGLISKTTDGSGNVSWSWKVGTRTKPGSYDVNITIGTQTITKTLNVD
jgi:hypothetical protein